MNKEELLFWLKGYMESMLKGKPPIGVVDDIDRMLHEINKTIAEPKQEKQLLTDSNNPRRVFPGINFVTDIS